MNRKKICYILPKYDLETDTHFNYLYNFIDRASEEADIYLIIEKKISDFKHFHKVNYISIIKHSNFFARFLETLYYTMLASFSGFRKFYVHYSYYGATASIFVSGITRGTVFYWNCGMPWLYKDSRVKESIFRYILSGVNLVTGTNTMKELYIKNYNLKRNKIFVLPNWIDLNKSKNDRKIFSKVKTELDIEESDKIVLFVHRLSERKGAHKIISVLEKIKDQRIKFVVVGDGPLRVRIESEIMHKNLAGRIKLTGSVSQREIDKYFRVASVFFMPSTEEGFPHVLLESMAYGVPYVASFVGGVGDISPDILKGYLVGGGDTIKFRDNIEKLLKNPIDPKILKDHVGNYDINKIVPIFLQLF